MRGQKKERRRGSRTGEEKKEDQDWEKKEMSSKSGKEKSRAGWQDGQARKCRVEDQAGRAGPRKDAQSCRGRTSKDGQS